MSRDQFNTPPSRGGYGAVREYTDSPPEQGVAAGGYSGGGGGYTNMNFDEMCEEISKNIYLINSGANKLDKSAQLIGTDKDSVKVRDRIHEASMTTASVVQKTMSVIRRVAASKQSDKMRQVQLDRLSTQFQESVQRFTRLQKSAADKVRMTGDVKEKVRGGADGYMDDYGDEASLIEQEKRLQQLQQQDENIENEVELIREREDRIRQLESDILDVNEIFRDLGAMIHEQGATIDLIETNVETAYGHVEQGTGQLGKASVYQKKARKKMCILLIILLIVAIIITTVIATQVGK